MCALTQQEIKTQHNQHTSHFMYLRDIRAIAGITHSPLFVCARVTILLALSQLNIFNITVNLSIKITIYQDDKLDL